MFPLSKKQNDVLTAKGFLLIIGGPGSGKTTVSIIKADKLITETLKPSQKILFLSFSRAAVSRVVEAIEENKILMKESKRRIDIDTYHSFFWRIIKTHGYLVGLPRKVTLLTPQEEAIALSSIRSKFPRPTKITAEQFSAKEKLETDELKRLAFKEGRVCFGMFAELTSNILLGSKKIRELTANLFPYIILDEFQDTSDDQWEVIKALGMESTMIALADPEQRIFDFLPTDPERLNHFKKAFTVSEFDFTDDNYRSSGTDITLFGNHVLTGNFKSEPYKGVTITKFKSNPVQAFFSLKLNVIQAIKRLIETKKQGWSLAILVPTKKLMQDISDDFRIKTHQFPIITHSAAIDMDAAILAAEIIAFLMQPIFTSEDEHTFINLLCNYFQGKGGGSPSASDLKESENILSRFENAVECLKNGKAIPKKSIYHQIHEGYVKARQYKFVGDPAKDWLAIRDILQNSNCPRLQQAAYDARNVRLLERGTALRDALAQDWRDNSNYTHALSIVRQAFVQEHFSTANKVEKGVIIMNMHKAKGKQFDEVIIFEGWPIISRGVIMNNPSRIVRRNIAGEGFIAAKQNFRVSITRAKTQVTILTPEDNSCILLP
jgi:DNA helicase-2/ATP-dependent DNA helicase PcrA